jgi:hypothetical protein
MNVRMWACMCVCMYLCLYVIMICYTYLSMYVCMHAYMYVCEHNACMCVFVVSVCTFVRMCLSNCVTGYLSPKTKTQYYLCFLLRAFIHTHKLIHTHTYIHTRTCRSARGQRSRHENDAFSCAHAHIHTHTHTCRGQRWSYEHNIFSCTHAHTYARARAHTHTHTGESAREQRSSYENSVFSCTHAHIHTLTYTHLRTHTHTQAKVPEDRDRAMKTMLSATYTTTSREYGSRGSLELFGVAQHGVRQDITKHFQYWVWVGLLVFFYLKRCQTGHGQTFPVLSLSLTRRVFIQSGAAQYGVSTCCSHNSEEITGCEWVSEWEK